MAAVESTFIATTVSLLIVNEDTHISPIEHPRYLSSAKISRGTRTQFFRRDRYQFFNDIAMRRTCGGCFTTLKKHSLRGVIAVQDVEPP